MKRLIAAIVLALAFASPSFAQESPTDECTLHGNIASNIVALKVQAGAPVEAVMASFASWLQSGMSGTDDAGRDLVKAWFNKRGGEAVEKWFHDVYNKYTDPVAANAAEKAACEQGKS